MMITRASPTSIKNELVRVVNKLSLDRVAAVLEFALFLESRQAQQQSVSPAQPVQRLEDLWGDFWLEDESVDDFISAVRRWRHKDTRTQ